MKNKKILLLALVTIAVLCLLALPGIAGAGWVGDTWNSITSGDACNDINDAVGPILDCSEENIVSFIGFEGELQPPSAEGLGETLTRATDLRKFIVNTLNFALSFLGIIALAIVIYGGFLYVTAAGNEEQSGKGKKSIMYAAIGIMVIIVSFALVNTLITFVGGEGTDTGSGSDGMQHAVGEEGSNIKQQIIYNLAAVEVNSALNDFVNAYKNLVNITGFIKKAKAMPKPGKREENKSYLDEVTAAITSIKNKTNSLSKTHIKAKNLLEGWLFETAGADLMSSDYEDGAIKDKFLKALEASGIELASKQDFDSAIDEIIGPENPAEPPEPPGKLNIVKDVLGDIAKTSASATIQKAIANGFISQKDLERAFAGIPFNKTVGEMFTETIETLKTARGLKEDPNQPDLVINAVKHLGLLHIIVKDIRFVYVKIKANIHEGNAPLIVELSGLDSRDPIGQTIPEENYEWDPDGDDAPGVAPATAGFAKVECTNESKGPTITCTYNQPGAYVAKLKIASQDPSFIANGVAFLPITVNPATARIFLKATVGSLTEELRKYEQDEEGKWQLVIDKNEFQVTSKEAKDIGIKYDASESKGANNSKLKNFNWTFGDGTGAVEGENTTTAEHKYAKEGKFSLTLEVTDTGDRKDRAIVNVAVGSIAARIGTSKTIAEPDELIEFDGTLSRSDKGSINSYAWEILDKDNKDVINFQGEINLFTDSSAPILNVKFKKPGAYAVKLTVSDGSGTATAQVPISIKSRKPRASFSAKVCPDNCADPSQPSLVEFDASASFDPDKTDKLTYNWEFSKDTGEKLEPGATITVLDKTPLSGKESKKVKVKFHEVGKYKALLRVNDSHTDPNIIQEDTVEKEIEIASIVEAKWDSGYIKKVVKLENGEAKFSFKAIIKNATRVEIDFGDSNIDEHGINEKDNDFTFENTYQKAGSYLVKAKFISDEGNGENTLSKYVYVTTGDQPLAVIEVSMDGNEIILEEPMLGGPKPALEVIRNKLIKFDASHSVSSGGKENGLSYSWDFGDNAKSSKPTIEHSYEDLSPGDKPFTVKLRVTEKADPNKTDEETFFVKVISKKPQVNTLSLEKKTPGSVTPVDVELTAEGAVDLDGKITNYQFWYFNPQDKETKFAVVDTQENHAILTIETAGEADEEHEYIFCVSVTDNENTISECNEMFTDNQLPKLKVKNGPNKAPIAAFSVDKTTVKVGEAVMFASGSKDEDGKITQYIWDTAGDGFQNDNPTDLSTLTYKYEKKSPQSGYKVKLKVVDDKGAAGYSKEIPIHVTAKSNPPTADFNYTIFDNPPLRVKFFDASKADSANNAKLVKWMWDFDTSAELGCNTAPKPDYCNGDKADDIDSTDQNPMFDFPTSGSYQVKLTVEDSDSNISEPKTALLLLIMGASGGPAGGPAGAETPPTGPQLLNAELKTDPKFTFEPLQQKKVLHFPPNSNGEPVTLSWGDSTGDIATYKIDKDIWCDWDGKGGINARADDIQNPDVSGGTCTVASTGAQANYCWTTYYSRFSKTAGELGHFTTKLTITDKQGNMDTDNVEIIFDGPIDPKDVLQDKCEKGGEMFKGSLFQKLGEKNTILLGLVSGVIVVLIGFGIGSLLSRNKKT